MMNYKLKGVSQRGSWGHLREAQDKLDDIKKDCAGQKILGLLCE